MSDELPKAFLENFLGWSLYQRGNEFVALLTDTPQNGIPPLRAKNLKALRDLVTDEDRIESATI